MERIASVAATSLAVAEETEMPSEEAPKGIADRVPVPAAAVVPQVWEDVEAAAAPAAGADGGESQRANLQEQRDEIRICK